MVKNRGKRRHQAKESAVSVRRIAFIDRLPDELLLHIFDNALETEQSYIRYGGYCTTCGDDYLFDFASIMLRFSLLLVNQRFRTLLNCDLHQHYQFLCERSEFISFPRWIEDGPKAAFDDGHLRLCVWLGNTNPIRPNVRGLWGMERYRFDGPSQDIRALSDAIATGKKLVQGHTRLLENDQRGSSASLALQNDFFAPMDTLTYLHNRFGDHLVCLQLTSPRLSTLRIESDSPSLFESLVSKATLTHFVNLQDLTLVLQASHAQSANSLLEALLQTKNKLRRLSLTLPYAFPPTMALVGSGIRRRLWAHTLRFTRLETLSMDCGVDTGSNSDDKALCYWAAPALKNVILRQRTVKRCKDFLEPTLRSITVLADRNGVLDFPFEQSDWLSLSRCKNLRLLTLQIREKSWTRMSCWTDEEEARYKAIVRDALRILSDTSAIAPIKQLMILHSHYITAEDLQTYLGRSEQSGRRLKALGTYHCTLIDEAAIEHLQLTFPRVRIVGVCRPQDDDDSEDDLDGTESVAPSFNLDRDECQSFPPKLNLHELFPGFEVDHLPDLST